MEQPAGVAFVLIQSCSTACSICQDKEMFVKVELQICRPAMTTVMTVLWAFVVNSLATTYPNKLGQACNFSNFRLTLCNTIHAMVTPSKSKEDVILKDPNHVIRGL